MGIFSIYMTQTSKRGFAFWLRSYLI